MPEHDDTDGQLRREFLRQAPRFDVTTSLPAKVSARVRRRQRVGTALALGAAAAVVAAIAVPLASLRSAPVGHTITPATAPASSTPSTTPSPTSTTPTAAVPVVSCGSLDLWTTATGTAVSTSATLGRVTVTMTGTAAATAENDPSLSGARLAVVVEGGGSFSETVVPPDQTSLVIPWSIAPLPSPAPSASTEPRSDGLCLAEFPGETLPVILLGLDTGGAHCCTVVRAITVSSTGLGPAVDDNVGNPTATVRPEAGHALIVTADNAFAYTFGTYAASGMPIRVLQFGHGAFVDVTRDHLDLVVQETAMWMTTFNGSPGNGLGALAAWVADECLVGHGATAWSTVNDLLAQGKLTGPDGWPTGAAYVSALRAFLTQHGYCAS